MLATGLLVCHARCACVSALHHFPRNGVRILPLGGRRPPVEVRVRLCIRHARACMCANAKHQTLGTQHWKTILPGLLVCALQAGRRTPQGQ